MTFDEDLLEAVRVAAPPGVHFEDDEIEAALVKATNQLHWGFPAIGPAVEMAASRALRARLPKLAPKPAGFWQRLADRLGWA